MRLQTIFQPKTILSRDEVRRGLRALTWETMASTGFSSLTTSTFLVAFALALGANNFQIGVLASIPFIADLLQIPAVWLIERFRRRKVIVLATWLFSQLLWIPIALIPIFMEIPDGRAISLLLGLMAVRGILNALTNCGWSSWQRDLVPHNILGRYLARRLSLATVVAVITGLSAGFFLDRWDGATGYSIVLLSGLIFFGLTSPVLMAVIPEPMMPPVSGPRTSFSQTLTAPLRERNFRHFMKFLMFWGLTSNMAIPFFAVYMLQQLNLPIFTVIALTMVSEVFTVVSLRFWGPLTDRFGSKTVLYMSSFLFLIVLGAWIITAVPKENTAMFLLLVMLHVLTGTAVAGITLAVETLSFKLAPHGRGTAYLTGASLAESAGTGLGAVAGGFLADLLQGHTFAFDLSWASFFQSIRLDSITLTGYHLLFAAALITGLITLRTLESVGEKGAIRREAVLPALMEDISALFSQVNLILDMTYLYVFPFNNTRQAPAAGEEIDVVINRFGNTSRKVAKIVPRARCLLEEKPPSWEME